MFGPFPHEKGEAAHHRRLVECGGWWEKRADDKGSIGLVNSISALFVEDKISLEQAKSQIEEKNIEVLNRTIMQMKIRKDNKNIN